MLQKDRTRGILAQKEMLKDFIRVYLLKCKELLLLDPLWLQNRSWNWIQVKASRS